MEAISVKEMKKWAKDTLPPMAWQRVTFRILPQLNKLNLSQLNKLNVFLHFFEQDDYILSEKIFKALDNTFLEIFGKRFPNVPTQIIVPIATETLAFVPTVVPVDEPTAKDSVIIPIDAPIIEKSEEVLPIDAPIIEKSEEVLPIDAPVVEKVEEILPIDAPIVEKVEEILSIDARIEENLAEILPNKESVLKELEGIKAQLTEIIKEKEEEKEPEKPTSKPFVPFFSFEQLKRIFGKK